MKKCAVCGTENESNAQHCVACGEATWVESAVVEPTVVRQPQPQHQQNKHQGRR